MDANLLSRLSDLNAQNDFLHQAEGEFRLQDAKKKTIESDIYLITVGGNVAERQAKVFANEDYASFMKELAQKETAYNHEKRRYDILLNAYFGELAQYKKEMDLIKHQK